LRHVLQVELVEMGETTVPAPDGEMAAPDCKIVRAENFAVPAPGFRHQVPQVVTADLRKTSRLCHVLNPGDKNTGGTAMTAGHLCLVRNGLDNLVCILSAVVADGPV